jgi:hypothetical protein
MTEIDINEILKEHVTRRLSASAASISMVTYPTCKCLGSW